MQDLSEWQLLFVVATAPLQRLKEAILRTEYVVIRWPLALRT